MRKWFVLAVAVSALAAGGVLLALRSLDARLNANRDWFARQAEATLGRRVGFERLSLSLRDGLAAEVQDLHVADDPAFASDDFLHVDHVRVRIKLLPALFGRYEIRRVELEAPRITLIRTADGLNIDSISRHGGEGAGGSAGEAVEHNAPSAVPVAALPLLVGDLQVHDASIRFVDRLATPAEEVGIDQVEIDATGLDTADGIRFVLDASRAAIDHRFLHKPAGVPLTLSLDAARRDHVLEVGRVVLELAALDITGKGRIDLAGGKDDMEISLPASPLAEIAPLFPSLRGLALDGHVAAHLQASGKRGALPQVQGKIELQGVEAEAKGSPWKLAAPSTIVTLANDSAVLPPTEMTFSGVPIRVEARIEKLSQPTVEFKAHAAEVRPAAFAAGARGQLDDIVLDDAAFDGAVYLGPQAAGWLVSFTSSAGNIRDLDYRNLRIAASLQGTSIVLRRLQIESGDGSIVARGSYDTGQSPPALEVNATLRDIDAAKVLSAAGHQGGPGLRGRLQARLELRGAGIDRASMLASLNGDANVRIANGSIEDFNVAESILGGLTGAQDLTDLVSPKVRERHPEIFSARSTRFDSLTATLGIASQRITTDDLLVAAPGYDVRGIGVVGFDQRVDLQGTFVASDTLAADIVSNAHAARLLINDQGRLEIPFRLEGKLSHLRLKPDSRFLVDTLQKAVGAGLDHLLQPKRKKHDKDGSRDDSLRKRLKKLFGH